MAVIAVLMLAMLAAGCLGFGSQGNGQNETGINGTLPSGTVENSTPAANATNKTPEVCMRQWTLCPSGEQIKTRDCIEGHKITWTCKPYWKAHNLTTDDIPAHLRFLADYKCYWENRQKFGYAAYYNPANLCAGPIVLGWIESCECGDYIDTKERAKLG